MTQSNPTAFPSDEPIVLAQFTDRFGAERTVRKYRNRIRVQQERVTPMLALNQAIGTLIGARVKARREACGLSQSELAALIGIEGGHPKQRIYHIETGKRKEAIRLGTLYALALALDCDPADLLPERDEVAQIAGIRSASVNRLVVRQ